MNINDFNLSSRVDRHMKSMYLNKKTGKFERILNFKGKINEKEAKWQLQIQLGNSSRI